MAKRLAAAENLVEEIESCIESGESYDTYLETDERVLARVTDGIYRQPSSALRELIANAYDADAKVVSVTTDAPRFSTIKVSDDGIGMNPDTFANLVEHIGGSAKRTKRGAKLGITAKKDPTRSNGGRRLIGKIGIGLFSVAQLTRQFVIITKTEGSNYQLIAHVTLNRFDEVDLAKVDEDNPFRAGSVRIWSEKTADKKGHGTTIILTALCRVWSISFRVVMFGQPWPRKKVPRVPGSASRPCGISGRSTRKIPNQCF
ncbi:MAG: ATP-binding protein [Gemmatales bacterium]